MFEVSFWALCTGHLDVYVGKLQKVIENKNKSRQKRYARPIRQVARSDFIIFML